MQKVLTAAEMREVDRLTTERYGIPSIILMENAAHAVARIITEKLGGSVRGTSILILCGKGNNGGDGAALGRILSNAGALVTISLFGNTESTKGNAKTNFEILKKIDFEQTSNESPEGGWNCNILTFEESDSPKKWADEYELEPSFDVVVDSIFGTGFKGTLDEQYRRIFSGEWFDTPDPVYGKPSLRVAVDLPSGLIADEPAAVTFNPQVDVTVTFTAPKPANVIPPASSLSKELFVADIGSPYALVAEQQSHIFLAERHDAEEWLRAAKFASNSYKNKRGHALIIAGSENYAGAAALCGNAAIRSGVGLVTIGTPRSSKDLVGGRVVPEVMVRPLAETESGAISEEAIAEIEKFSKNIDAIAIGAGLSASDESTGRFVRHFLENRTMPTLLDADALTLLSPFQRVSTARVSTSSVSTPHVSKGSDGDEATRPKPDPPVILTPHEGEFMKLLGTDDKEAIKDRVGAVRKFAQENNVILVLKGERVLIGEPGGKVVVNPTGNSGLGKAGNGDTLLGILAGFVAQAAAMEIAMFETIVAGVYVAGLAGDIAAEKFGKRVMTASDTRDCLAEAFRRCEGEN